MVGEREGDSLDPHPHPEKHMSRTKDASLLTRLDLLVDELETNLERLRRIVEEEKRSKEGQPGD